MSGNVVDPSYKPLIKQIVGDNARVFTAVMAKVMYAKPNPHKWNRFVLSGILILIKDTSRNSSLFFVLVDIDKKKKIWDHEIYIGFNFLQENDSFYTFASDSCVIGVWFLDKDGAKRFSSILKKKMEILRIDVVPENKKGIMSIFKKKKAPERKFIGEPRAFRQVRHVGQDANGGFSLENIPKEWMSIFEKAGIKKDQLENKVTANFILDVVNKYCTKKESDDIFDDEEDNVSLSSPKKISPVIPTKENPVCSSTREATVNMPRDSTSINPPMKPPLRAKSTVPPPPPRAKYVIPPPPPSNNQNVSDVDTKEKDSSNLRDKLLESIRSSNVSNLKKASDRTLPPAPSDKDNVIASLLAKALSDRDKTASPVDDGDEEEW